MNILEMTGFTIVALGVLVIIIIIPVIIALLWVRVTKRHMIGKRNRKFYKSNPGLLRYDPELELYLEDPERFKDIKKPAPSWQEQSRNFKIGRLKIGIRIRDQMTLGEYLYEKYYPYYSPKEGFKLKLIEEELGIEIPKPTGSQSTVRIDERGYRFISTKARPYI